MFVRPEASLMKIFFSQKNHQKICLECCDYPFSTLALERQICQIFKSDCQIIMSINTYFQ
jgi:hypothetical protein